ncbi:hypothetical protein AALA79_01935 [Lachnospiraceae bacterium 64-25]
MAVVREYCSPEGCRITVHDDCYKDKTPEETQQIISRVSEIILRAEYARYIANQRNAN